MYAQFLQVISSPRQKLSFPIKLIRMHSASVLCRRADVENLDFIIIGAGSAGCVLADRLSEPAGNRVLLLEAGGVASTPWISIPIGYGKLFYDKRNNWKFNTLPDAGLKNRRGYWPRGKVVGGSGSINALVYCRGVAADFDDWQAQGAQGWNWETVREGYDRIEAAGSGRINVADVSDQLHPCTARYFEALRELQLPVTDDCNGPDPEGGTAYRLNTYNGRRHSSATAYLKPALGRNNLVLRTGAAVQRILFKGTRAVGVEVRENGELRRYRARKEVILSAGAIGSPQLLQLSGIGPGELLQRNGIEVRVANNNVGGNLQDHLAISYYYKATQPTLNTTLAPLMGKIRAGIQYALTRRGPLSLSVNQCGGFFRSTPGLPTPDQQFYFNPVTYSVTNTNKRTVINPDPFPGFTIGSQPTRPTSRGRVDIASPDADAAPDIRPNSLASEADQISAIAAGKLCRKIMHSDAMQRLATGSIGPDVRTMNDAALLEDFRARASTVFHPVSTCRMGADIKTAVSNSQLQVFGVEGLRVIDASAFPSITSGNTNAPTMMLANRGADLVLKTGTRP